ncbi:MAG TPA: hypothetical protein VK591_16740 [Xanthobacteraceae bacterium]|nr:hypothetical protein [Xanthobacteraceae bacterium]
MREIRASAPALRVVAAPQAACFDFAAMINPGKAEKWAARSARLAARLRENLKRRKEQARGRKAEDVAAADADIGTAPDFRRNPGGKVGGGSGGPATGRGG